MPTVPIDRLPADLPAPEVLIIGAGAVGIAMAVDLARRGVRALVLEGGPADPRMDWERRNEGRSLGRPFDGLKTGRMQALGGTTRLWGGQLVPFGPRDFVGEPALGKPAWPIAYADFVPWVDAAYDLLGVPAGGRDTVALWSKATGRADALGGDLHIGMNIWLNQPDFAQGFARDLADLPHLTVVTGARVRGLHFGAQGEVSAVEVQSANAPPRRFSAPHVVLANGTFEIVRLLLSTAATRPDCGFADNRHIGRWFVDHLHGLCGRFSGENRALLSQIFDNIYVDGTKYNVKIRAGDALRARAGIGNVAATLNAPLGLRATLRDLKGLAGRILAGDGRGALATIRQSLRLAAVLVPVVWRYVVDRRSSTILGREVWLGLELEQVPTDKSYITLDPDYPPETAPVLLHWDLDGVELRTARVMAEEVAARFAEGGFGHVEIDPRLLAEDPAWLDQCHDAKHQIGGARMAASAAEGVVDADCRVFGTQNLFIAGAAVFPSGSFANPTLSAIALSLRLSAHLFGRVLVGVAGCC